MATPLVSYVHQGASIDYTPGADVAAGDVVVQGELVGVAKLDIAANTLGALAVQGVFDFPKSTAASSGIPTGSIVYWDAAAKQATTNPAAGANKKIGPTIGTLGTQDADALVRVRMSQ